MLNATDQRLAPQAYERILDLILSGKTPPGDLLNERALAEMFDMSRTPIRDALLMLESEGLLVRRGRRGLQVKQMRLEDLIDALQIRLLLEPAVARMTAGNVDRDALQTLSTRFQELLESADKTNGGVNREMARTLDNQLHGLISDAAGNAQLSSIILTLRRQTQIFDIKSLPERAQDTCREHLDIIDALLAGDGDSASAAMARHIDGVRESIIARLTRR
ncbi:GntR family transcriptional regulator [Nioella sp.]|jgi:DNA-binding GntR family transcriptional regulator|uniref:GntR family transcriptional regulator n=1 Tax=Nioella sp. TaxID=1912091 RepID=UPI003A86B495